MGICGDGESIYIASTSTLRVVDRLHAGVGVSSTRDGIGRDGGFQFPHFCGRQLHRDRCQVLLQIFPPLGPRKWGPCLRSSPHQRQRELFDCYAVPLGDDLQLFDQQEVLVECPTGEPEINRGARLLVSHSLVKSVGSDEDQRSFRWKARVTMSRVGTVGTEMGTRDLLIFKEKKVVITVLFPCSQLLGSLSQRTFRVHCLDRNM